MRTIKYRGKDSFYEWVYGSLIIDEVENDNGKFMVTFIAPSIPCASNGRDMWTAKMKRVKPKTIGQFTGLFDKNGMEIYEGDILRKPAKEQWEIKNFVGYEVFWHDNDCADNHIGWQMNRHHYNGCLCGTTDFVKCLPKYCSKMEIIGNIHDNPKLIKEIMEIKVE